MLSNDKAQLQNVHRLGLMGGTFDPIHHGHLLLAESALYQFSLDKVVFIPSRRPPHKVSQAELDAEQRAVMTELAIAGEPGFFMSRCELEREGYSYAYDTLLYLRELLPDDAEIYFITGADSILDVTHWYRAAELPKLARFIAAARPGYELSGLADMPQAWRDAVELMPIPLMDISSTDIRRRVAAGESISYLLPEKVADYIHQQGLYRRSFLPGRDGSVDKEWLRERLAEQLSPKRYQHSLGVAELAQKWAARWQLDQEQAYIAGLLHDVARELSHEKLLELAHDFGLTVDQATLESPVILHAEVGACLVQQEWGLDAPDILQAISRHTIPDSNMPPLARLIYLADICEPNRRWWPGKGQLMTLCVHDLNQAMVCALEQNLDYLKEHQRRPHPRTAAVLADYRRLVAEEPGRAHP